MSSLQPRAHDRAPDRRLIRRHVNDRFPWRKNLRHFFGEPILIATGAGAVFLSCISCISWLNKAALIWLRAQPPEARSDLQIHRRWMHRLVLLSAFDRISQPDRRSRAVEPNDPGKMRWRGWSDLTARRFKIPRAQTHGFPVLFSKTVLPEAGALARAQPRPQAGWPTLTKPNRKTVRSNQRVGVNALHLCRASPRRGQRPRRNPRRDRNRPRPEP